MNTSTPTTRTLTSQLLATAATASGYDSQWNAGFKEAHKVIGSKLAVVNDVQSRDTDAERADDNLIILTEIVRVAQSASSYDSQWNAGFKEAHKVIAAQLLASIVL